MADVAVPPRIPLVVIPGVELVEVGDDWPASTGPRTFTPEDLVAAVAAQADPAVRSPILRLGHVRQGQPAFGRFTNLRTTNSGMTLVADLVGAPQWMAELLPYAFPSRSIEARIDATTATGNTWALVIDAVALLGVELPAISTLDEVAAVYAAETMAEAHVTLTDQVAAARGGAMPPLTIAASVTTEDVRRAYYSQLSSAQAFWWIRFMRIDPLELIVDDDEGGFWRVAVTISGEEITFADPVPQEFVDDSAGSVAATSAMPGERRSIVFANRSASRGGLMDPAQLRQTLGLAAEATDEEVMARAAELAARPDPAAEGAGTGTEPPAGSAGGSPAAPPAVPIAAAQAAVPPGFVLVSEANWAQVQANATAGAEASRTLAQQAEDGFIARHRHRIGPVGNPHAQAVESHLRDRFRSDRTAAETFAASLAVVVPTVAAGHDSPGQEGDADDAKWDNFLRGLNPAVAAVRSERDARSNGGK